jgi:hypothetical protein
MYNTQNNKFFFLRCCDYGIRSKNADEIIQVSSSTPFPFSSVQNMSLINGKCMDLGRAINIGWQGPTMGLPFSQFHLKWYLMIFLSFLLPPCFTAFARLKCDVTYTLSFDLPDNPLWYHHPFSWR